MSGVIRPEGTITLEEKIRHLQGGVEQTIVSLTHQIALHLYQVRIVKMGDYEEVSTEELAKQTMSQALGLAIKSLKYLDTQAPRIEAASNQLAKMILKRSPDLVG